jgi:hypothetical protein
MTAKPLSRMFAILLALAFVGTASVRAQDAAKPADAATPAAPAPAEQPAATPAPASEGGMTQGEAALALVNKLGLFPALPNNPSSQEAAASLAAQGISPFEGWKPDETLTVGDFAKVLVEAMGRQDEIADENKDKPEAYVELLKGMGINIESSAAGLDEVPTLVEVFNAAVDGASLNTDPLRSRTIYGQNDEWTLGPDGSTVLRAQRGTPVVTPPVVTPVVPPPPRREEPTTPTRPVNPSPVVPVTVNT